MALSEMNYVESKIAQIDYNYVKSVVDSHIHTYELKAYDARANINEGGVYIDTSNKVAYLYADYDTLKAIATPSTFNTFIMIDGSSSYIMNLAPNSSSANVNKIINIESTTATNSPIVNLYPYNNANGEIRIGYTKSNTVGENFKIWAVWSIRTA